MAQLSQHGGYVPSVVSAVIDDMQDGVCIG